MEDPQRTPEFPADEVASDERFSPEAMQAILAQSRQSDEELDNEERLTAEVDEADDEPDEPDELEPDARPGAAPTPV